MPEIDVANLFGLEPEQVVKYFRQKGFTFSWRWQDTLEEAHARAFTVARALRLDILQDIRDSLDRAILEGRTFEQFQRELMPTLQTKGWWGKVMVGDGAGGGELVQLGSPRRLRTIYDVNLQVANQAGRYKSQWEDRENRPYWMYVAVLDSRTRPLHRALNGKVFRADDPFWLYFYPPNGWRCRCRVRALTAAEVKSLGLTVESSEGSLTFKDVLLDSKTGEIIQVAEYRGMDAAGKPFTVSPDAAWSYNPGRAWMEPFTPRPMDTDLAGGVKTVGASTHPKTPIDELPAKRLNKDMLLPSHKASGWSEEEYLAKFLDEFGAAIDKPAVFRDVVGDPVVISEQLFWNRKAGKAKVVKRDREVYLPLLADTIKDPAEIWLTEVEYGGEVRFCKRYVSIYRDDNNKVGGFAVFDLIDGWWRGTTSYSPDKLSYLDSQRSGTLLYTKK